MPVQLLNQKNLFVEDYPPDLVELLTEGALTPEATKELDRLHRGRFRIKCSCARTLHVVSANTPFLRRNPGQQRSPKQCGLCESDGLARRRGSALAIPEANARIGLILSTPRHPKKKEKTPNPPPSGGESKIRKYHRAFGVLYHLMDSAGFTALSSWLDWENIWERLKTRLSAAKIHENSGYTFADYAWMPGRKYSGGLPDLNRRLKMWDHPDMQAEGLLFGVLDETPVAGEVNVYGMSQRSRAALHAQGRALYPPYKFQVSRYSVACVGRNPPYIAMAVCTPNPEGDPQYSRPIFHRLILQSILEAEWPLPVESSHEADTAYLLSRLGVPFLKPVFSNKENIRPDFVLPQHKIVIEVQGMRDEVYKQSKRIMHERIRSSESYGGFRLITYDPNEGENIADFETKLNSLM